MSEELGASSMPHCERRERVGQSLATCSMFALPVLIIPPSHWEAVTVMDGPDLLFPSFLWLQQQAPVFYFFLFFPHVAPAVAVDASAGRFVDRSVCFSRATNGRSFFFSSLPYVLCGNSGSSIFTASFHRHVSLSLLLSRLKEKNLY